MNNTFIQDKFFIGLFLLYSASATSQLVKSDIKLWEKVHTDSRTSNQCKDDKLLNFHCGIEHQLSNSKIQYDKNKSYTLAVVHSSKEDELIWNNEGQQIVLSNTIFRDSYKDKNIELRKRPSFFSFAAHADPKKDKTDSLMIKLSDQNLYEMIFIPRKAKKMELNKIHSYLAIKYGISLDKGIYYSSGEKVIWDPEKHKDYLYRTTGLGRDDGNELYQKQSSNQADLFLTIGMNEINRTNADNASAIDDHNFVMWSDDNKAMSLTADKGLDVLERNWEISFIGNTIPKDNYNVRVNKDRVNPRSLPLNYWMLFKKDNGEWVKIQGAENEGFVTFSKVDFKNVLNSIHTAHFTFAVSPLNNKEDGNSGSVTSSETPANQMALDISKINLYPNPVRKDQNFTIVFPPMDNLSVSVYDGGGRLVVLDKIDRNARSYVNHLGIQSSYLIVLTQNGKILKTFKLIVD
ncbi:T9SS type A sorting domain-containing protein [uncultured Chryseobacterium sp.]|uniref:T9SS type A sorting domain-containing protein n=1 Tax=uncultured Chryseobacterium sp. TaxID=259322 RepID=UPI0025E9F1F5|nr:T9SS type A sorting domain-containing protein [uncultured Chryseobacterium sp.]